MRIALISAEFASLPYSGGIGTYMRNVTDMLAMRGHEVEAFAAGEKTETVTRVDGVTINTVACKVRGEFAELITPVFLERHARVPFKLIEGAESLAETSRVAAAVPDVPIVLKLHTPSSLIGTIDVAAVSGFAKARFYVGALRRLSFPTKAPWIYDFSRDFELSNLKTASVVTAPCRAIVSKLEELWPGALSDTVVVPNVYTPEPGLISIPTDTSTNSVTFFGRLEHRKGVADLAEAIPLILRAVPSAKFRLVGSSIRWPWSSVQTKDIVKEKLGKAIGSVEFVDSVEHTKIGTFLRETDVCVIPSVWENFPYVCLEAMAAGRSVVGSSAGGMAEIIQDGKTGLLVPPRSPRAIADAVISLLRDPARRARMGLAARQHVTSAYSPETIYPLQMASYERAIARKRDVERQYDPSRVEVSR